MGKRERDDNGTIAELRSVEAEEASLENYDFILKRHASPFRKQARFCKLTGDTFPFQ